MDPGTVRRRWSVVLERTVRELQGISCIDFETAPPPRKEIVCTRSFGGTVTTIGELAEAITAFTTRAAERLRRQQLEATRLMVFIHTSPFRKDERQYSKSVTVPLRRPTADTAQLLHASMMGLRAIYREGFNFAKAGVHLLELQPAGIEQGELDLDNHAPGRERLMSALDGLNDRYGRGTVYLASAGAAHAKKEWAMRQELKTPEYTTRYADIPIAIV